MTDDVLVEERLENKVKSAEKTERMVRFPAVRAGIFNQLD